MGDLHDKCEAVISAGMLKNRTLDASARRNPVALLWYVALSVAIGGAIVGLLRLLDIMWVGHYHKVLVPLAMLVSVLVLQKERRIRLDAFGLCLLAAILWGIVIGLVHGGSVRPFLSHLGAGVFAFLVYSASRAKPADAEWLRSFARAASYAILVSYALSIAAFWTISTVTGNVLYLGIGTGDMLFAMSYFLVYRLRWPAVFCLLVVLLSGKRGALLAMLVLMLYGVGVSWLRGFYRRTLLACLAAAALIWVSLYFRDSVVSVGWPSPISSVLDKWYQIDPSSENFDIDVAFSGRNQEIILAFGKFMSRAHHWVTGMGYGWSYFYDARIPGSETTDFISHYVHLSPANFVLLYGAPMALVVLFLMQRVIARSYRIREEDTAGRMRKVLALYCISAFVSSLSGYTYATDPLFWMALGVLSTADTWRGGRHSQ